MFAYITSWLYKEPESSKVNRNETDLDQGSVDKVSVDDNLNENSLNENNNNLNEVASLRAVLELKNEEIKKLRKEALLKEEFHELKEKLEKFQARIEDLEAKLEKCTTERNELRVENHQLVEEKTKVYNKMKNLEFQNDQLSWNLETYKKNPLSVTL